MKIAGKSMFASVLMRIFVSGLLFAVIFTTRVNAIIPISCQDIIAARGWDMGMCRVPNGPNTTSPVYFVSGEIINMPIHINKLQDNPDQRDIYMVDTNGGPVFTEKVEIGESRYANDGNDKYEAVMSCFQNDIDFNVPDSNINNEAAVQDMIDSFRNSTIAEYNFIPPGRAVTGNVGSSDPCGAVQLQFYIDANGTGKIRIFPSCTVRHYRRSSSYPTWDYNAVPDGSKFNKYDIYAYHYFDPNDGNNKTVNITDTYIDQNVGGQIFVDGHVIIGGDSNASMWDPNQRVKGKITVIATGNIWIGDAIFIYEFHDANGMPMEDNPNFLNLIAQRVIKVVDPGMSSYGSSSYSYPTVPGASPCHLYPSIKAIGVNDSVYGATHKHFYQPIGMKKNPADANNVRYLPHDMVIEAAMTICGGGFGAENVATSSSGPNRKEYTTGTLDHLIVHGAIAEVLRGVVGLPAQNDGFIKDYHYDRRLNPPPEEQHGQFIGDLNGDCALDFNDVAILTEHWLENHLSGDDPPVCASLIQGDLNFDCVVDFIDFAIQAQHWLGNDICY